MRNISVFKPSAFPPPPIAELKTVPLQIVGAPSSREAQDAAGSAPIVALEIVQLKAEYERQLAGIAATGEAAAAEIAALRRERAGHLEQVALERRVSAEFSKKLSASQKELEAATATVATLQTERDKAITHLAALEISREKGTGRAGDGEQAEWEIRVSSQFEEDIETYRKRIRTLLAERDALQLEHEKMSARLAELSAVAGH